MPKYRVLAKSYVNNSLVEPGEIVNYEGRPGSNLELIKGEKPWIESKEKPVSASSRTPNISAEKSKGTIQETDEDVEENSDEDI